MCRVKAKVILKSLPYSTALVLISENYILNSELSARQVIVYLATSMQVRHVTVSKYTLDIFFA